MIYEKSCGVVCFTRVDGEIRYVIAQARDGNNGFPKGHVESDETEHETALREVYEEVHLRPTLIDGFRETIEYDIARINVHKQVVFFLGEFYDQKIIWQKEELRKAMTVPYEEAMALLQHPENRRLLTLANAFLTGK